MSRKSEIRKFMIKKLAYLTAVSDQGEGKGMLANLRKGVGSAPGEIPSLLGVLLEDMPDKFMAKGTEPTREEWACYTALTLFAMHQQGNDLKSSPMNTADDVSIGKAMAEYVQRAEDSNAEKRMTVKLQTLATSKDMKEFSYHLKAIIQLLKTKGIPLNYPRLAGDVYEYQFQDNRPGIFLRWGQDFYVRMNASTYNDNLLNSEKEKEEQNNE